VTDYKSAMPEKSATSGRLTISGDGSKKKLQGYDFIQAWSIWTGEPLGQVHHYVERGSGLIVDGSRVGVVFSGSETQWWDFGITGLTPIPLSNTSMNRPHLKIVREIKHWKTGPSSIEDTVTGKKVFQLSGRYTDPFDLQWDGQYLVAGYHSGEVLILDFNHLLPQ